MIALPACVSVAAGIARAQTDVPPTPANLVASAGQNGRIDIRWTDSPQVETGLRIQRDPNFAEGVIDLPPGTIGFYDQPGHGFFTYHVWAYNSIGASGVATTDRFHITSGVAGPHGIIDPSTSGSGGSSGGSAVPTAPRRLHAVPGSGSVSLTWEDRSNNETAFRIGRETSVAGVWGADQTFDVPANQVTFNQSVDAGLYRYRVQAVNGTSASAFTSWVITTVDSGSTGSTGQPPLAPTGLTVSDIGGGRAMVSWVDVATDETQYQVERIPAMASGVAILGANTTAYIDQCGNGTFGYRVWASNANGSSAVVGPVSCNVTSGATGGSGSTGGTGSTGTAGTDPGGGGTTASGGSGGTCGGGTTGGGGSSGTGGTGTADTLVGTALYPGMTVGADGWTALAPSSDTRIVYVSSSSGSDANDGLSQGTPKQTLAGAFPLLRDGYPDWLVLKSGDTWTEALPWWSKSGRSQTEPMVVGSYGSGDRPLLKTGTAPGFQTSAFVGVPRQHIAVVDLHFWAHTNNGTGAAAGITLTNGVNDILIENCYVEQYPINISAQGIETRPTNVKIRRTIAANALSTSGRSTGMIFLYSDNILVEDCILDHNGWSETFSGCTPTIFSHNIYINPDITSGVSVRNCIVARGAASGIRSTGQLCENNLLLQNPVGLALGPDTRVVRNNVFLDSRDIDVNNPRGLGMDGTIGANVEIYGNILAHQSTGTSNVKAMNLWGIYSGLLLHDNIVYDWVQASNNQAVAMALEGAPTTMVRVYNNQLQQANGSLYQQFQPVPAGMYSFTGNRYFASSNTQPFLESPTWMNYSQWLIFSQESGSSFSPVTYPDPSRTIATYMTSIGGSPTLDAFLTEARNQSKSNWRQQYTSAAVNAYIRDGFGVTMGTP
jgi:hypothetical protein